jgi:syncollin
MPFSRLIRSGLAAAILCTVSASTALATCTLYQHRDYGGAYWILHHNDRMIMARGESIGTTTNGHCPSCDSRTLYRPDWNDHVSSFRVSGGCTLTMWEHIDQRGARFRSNRSYRYVGSGWNDRASEAFCSCARG